MPSKYVYKKRGKTQNYTQDTLERAVNAVKDGTMSIRESAVHFNVPRSTIGDRMSGKHQMHVLNGRPPHIPREVEDKIVDAVKMAARRGIGLTRKQILVRTNVLCRRTKVGGGYTAFKAGKDWWEGLKRRHPDISIRKPERLTTTRARMMNRQVMGRYFNDLGTILDGLHLLEKPYAVWNCDEVGKNFEHNPSRVVAAKGEDCVSRTSSKSTNITVMACVNGAGRRMPPMFIVKGKTTKALHGFNTEAAPTGSRWFYQKNGWTDDHIGEKWFSEVFLEFCGSARPQLLILDGHSSHETLAILMRAMDENIHILSLPPHTTHYAQPLDRAVFGPLNTKYNEACSEFVQQSPLNQVNKWTFPALFRYAWDNAVTSSNIISGFKACGIVPFNPEAIPSKAYGPSETTDVPIVPSKVQDVPHSSSPVRPTVSGDATLSFATTSISTDGNVTQDLVLSPSSTSECLAEMFMPQDQFVASPIANPTVSPVASPITNTFVSPVLDLADPTQLLQLIGDGAVATELVMDEGIGASITLPLNTIDNTINEVFVPPSATEKPVLKRQRNNITSHRLLTSEDIINEKIRIENIKAEKEEKKKARQLKKTVPKNVKKIKIEKEN